MERKEAMLKTGCSRILWIVMAVLLPAVPCIADLIYVDGTNSPYVLEAEVADYIVVTATGTLQLMDGGYTSDLLYVDADGTLEIYGSHTWISSDTPVEIGSSANVTLFTDSIDSILLESTNPPDATIVGTTITVDATNGWTGKLTWDYEGTEYSLNISTFSDIAIEVVGSEDPADLILQLIITVADLNLQNGIENSLDAKLGAALNALDDVNANNDVAAVNTLQAFINAVEAQRDNKITNEEANILVAASQLIIDLLSAE